MILLKAVCDLSEGKFVVSIGVALFYSRQGSGFGDLAVGEVLDTLSNSVEVGFWDGGKLEESIANIFLLCLIEVMCLHAGSNLLVSEDSVIAGVA